MHSPTKTSLNSPLLPTNHRSNSRNYPPPPNVSSPINRVGHYFHTHLSIFAIPSTLCFMGALATFVKTQSFTSLVGQLGEGNISLIFAALGMPWFVLLRYLKKLRVVDKERSLVKLVAELVSFATDMALIMLYLHGVISDAAVLLLLMGCTINLADFSGFGGRVNHMCMSYEGFVVIGFLFVYMFFRIWIYV